MRDDDEGPTGYRHVGHVRTTDGDLAAVVTPLLRHALDCGGRVVVACPEDLARTLTTALAAGDQIQVLPPQPPDTRPAAAVANLTALVDRELPDDGRRLHLVTTVAPAVRRAGWMQTEALFNHVLADRPVDHLCLMGPAEESSAADRGPGPVEMARATHPFLLTPAGVVGNPHYREPLDVIAELQQAAVPDPLEATEPALSLMDLDDMRTLRRSVHQVLADSPLTPDAAEDFVLAIDEVAANAAEHGVPPVDVRLWCGGDRLLCSITDRGACFDDPLAGYGPAHGDMAVGGMGLWLARRSVDSLVAAPSGDGSGCTVRLVVNA